MRILTCRTNETAKYSVNELIKYIRMITNCEIMPEYEYADAYPAIPCEDTIVLGLLDELNLDTSDLNDPFVDDIIDIKIENGVGYIAGSNDRSILMGVYKYCTSAGCAFVRPGEGGEYIPYCDLSKHSYTYRKKADYPFRGECCEGAISYEHMRDTVYWMPKVGMNMYMIESLVPYRYMHKWYGHVGNRVLREKKQVTDYHLMEEYTNKLEMDIVKTGVQLHTIGHGWMFEKFGVHHCANVDERKALKEEDKKYLAKVNGVRDICKNSTFFTHFCYSNPEARKILVDFCVEYVQKKPHVDYLHVWLADAINNHCECEECVKMEPSDWYVMLLNEIDEALTGIESKTRLVFILYNDTVRPPVNLRLKHPENFLLLAAIGGAYEQPYHYDEFTGEVPPYERNNYKGISNALRLKWHDEWKELCNNTPSVIYEYRFYTDMYCDPGYMRVSNETQRDMRLLNDINFQGCMSDQTHRMYLPTSLPLFTMGETLFDKELDYEAMLNRYFLGAFGEDGQKCREYLETLSDLFCPANLRALAVAGTEEEGLVMADGKPTNWKNNRAVAEKTAKIQAVLDAFLPTIEKNMLLEDGCQRMSWTYLRYHLRMCALLAKAINAGASGDMDKAREEYDKLELYLSKIEMDIHNVFDVFLFERFYRPKFDLPAYPYYN